MSGKKEGDWKTDGLLCLCKLGYDSPDDHRASGYCDADPGVPGRKCFTDVRFPAGNPGCGRSDRGLGAGLFSEKLKIRSNWKLLLACGILLIPMGVVLLLNSPAYIAYSVLAAAGMGIMALASIYTIQVMSYIQITVPRELVGKVIAWIIAISTCTQPIGQVIYGVLFEEMAGYLWLIFFFAGALLSLCIVFYSRKISEQL